LKPPFRPKSERLLRAKIDGGKADLPRYMKLAIITSGSMPLISASSNPL